LVSYDLILPFQKQKSGGAFLANFLLINVANIFLYPFNFFGLIKSNRKFSFMKLTAALLFSIILFGACKKTEIQQVNQIFSAVYSVQGSSWATTDGGLSYSTSLTVPELDNVIQAQGGVVVYLSFDNGTDYEAIPEVFDGIAYGAIHATGSVTLDLHAVSGSTLTPPTGTILAKVLLLDATALPN
jgi:hypothetical protein